MKWLVLGIPRRLRNVVVVLCLVIAAQGGFTFTGPYRWCSELQTRFTGSYSPKLSFLLAFLGLLLPAIAALQLSRRLGVLPGVSAETVEADRLADQKQREHIRRWRPWAIAIALGLTLTFLAARHLQVASAGGTLERVTMAQLESGQRPKGSWLELDGELPRDPAGVDMLRFTEQAVTTIYQPLRSPAHAPGQPLALVLVYKEGDTVALTPPLRGMLSPEGLPAPIAQLWQEAGTDPSHALVLELGVNPSAHKQRYLWLLAAGLSVLAGTLITYIIKRQRSIS